HSRQSTVNVIACCHDLIVLGGRAALIGPEIGLELVSGIAKSMRHFDSDSQIIEYSMDTLIVLSHTSFNTSLAKNKKLVDAMLNELGLISIAMNAIVTQSPNLVL
ncbi:hypothetical protein PENTCL1PPCAC_7859, partial [Pristionchus entomophagus]